MKSWIARTLPNQYVNKQHHKRAACGELSLISLQNALCLTSGLTQIVFSVVVPEYNREQKNVYLHEEPGHGSIYATGWAESHAEANHTRMPQGRYKVWSQL